ncbi:MAG: hypothetical protein J5990_06930 [Bacteroidales bacterium]|nr:hypothetical protein [Bacteroidales bacterium]
MKTIKYLAGFLAAASILISCEEANVLNNQNKDKEKPSVTLKQKVADDVTLSFEITASENASQYAYAVFAGSDNPVPSAYDILVEEALADASGSFNTSLSEEDSFENTVTVDCTEFPAETYQVFAAAITETGLIGEVVTLDVTMNDTWIPQPAGASFDKNVLTLAFDETVVRGKGKAYVSVIAWGVSAYYVKDQVIAEENITVEANTVTLVCPEAGNGAGYYVSFEEGLVTDLSGNKCAQCVSGLDQTGEYVNLGWDTDSVAIPITESNFTEPADNVNWAAEDANIVFTLPTEVMVNSKVKNPISVVYLEAEGQSILYAEWTLGEDGKTVTVYLPKMPTGEFDVLVAAGAFYDVWGNVTTAFEPSKLRYSNFLVDLKPGYYLIDYAWDTEEGVETSQFISMFEKLDNSTIVMSADWFELNGGAAFANPQLVGTVDYATSTIVFDGTFLFKGAIYDDSAFGMGFYQFDSGETLVFFGGGNGADPIRVKFDEEGYFTEISYCEYGVYTDAYLGAYSYCPDGSKLTYVPMEESATRQMSNAKTHVKELKENFRSGFTK